MMATTTQVVRMFMAVTLASRPIGYPSTIRRRGRTFRSMMMATSAATALVTRLRIGLPLLFGLGLLGLLVTDVQPGQAQKGQAGQDLHRDTRQHPGRVLRAFP